MTEKSPEMAVVADVFRELVNRVCEKAMQMSGDDPHLAEAVLYAAYGRVHNLTRVTHANSIIAHARDAEEKNREDPLVPAGE